jgi:hypothetical protein
MNPRKISLMTTGGRTPSMNRKDYQNAPSAKAPEPAGPPFNMNLCKLDDTNVPLWMHGFWGHSCGCGEKNY